MYFAKIVSSLVCKFFLWVAVTKVNHKVISILIQTNMYSLYPLQTFDTLQAMLHSKKYFLTLRICEFIVFPKRMNSISKLHSITLHSSPSYNTILNFAVSIIKYLKYIMYLTSITRKCSQNTIFQTCIYLLSGLPSWNIKPRNFLHSVHVPIYRMFIKIW